MNDSQMVLEEKAGIIEASKNIQKDHFVYLDEYGTARTCNKDQHPINITILVGCLKTSAAVDDLVADLRQQESFL